MTDRAPKPTADPVASALVPQITPRLSDELFRRYKDAAQREGISGEQFAREAILEKITRSELHAQLEEIRARLDALEQAAGIQH